MRAEEDLVDAPSIIPSPIPKKLAMSRKFFKLAKTPTSDVR